MSRPRPDAPTLFDWTAPASQALSPRGLARSFQKTYPGHEFLFETQSGHAPSRRFSLVTAEPLFLFLAHEDRCLWRDPLGTVRFKGKPPALLASLAREMAGLGLKEKTPGLFPMTGWFSYEAGRYFEKLPRLKVPVPAVPDAYFFLPRTWAWMDTAAARWRFRRCLAGDAWFRRLRGALGIALAQGHSRAPGTRQEFERECRDLVAGAAEDPRGGRRHDIRLRGLSNRAVYQAGVRKIKAFIGQGDILQANLSHGLKADFGGKPFDLFANLARINPSPFAMFAGLPGLDVVSASPERLFSQRGDRVETLPIAGTHPRGVDAAADRALRAQLKLSPKEKAEHLMLVDLERNDLGRVCRPGSVKVLEFMRIKKLSHVHHIVSRVGGRLKPGKSILDLLAAGFPGGTITGAPKIRSMEIIAGLEKQGRGLYTGSAGYWDPVHRQADFNILIRTILVSGKKAYFRVGAGIVADSDPVREWEETLHKAAALIEALETT